MIEKYSPTKKDVSKFLQKIKNQVKRMKIWQEQKHEPRL